MVDMVIQLVFYCGNFDLHAFTQTSNLVWDSKLSHFRWGVDRRRLKPIGFNLTGLVATCTIRTLVYSIELLFISQLTHYSYVSAFAPISFFSPCPIYYIDLKLIYPTLIISTHDVTSLLHFLWLGSIFVRGFLNSPQSGYYYLIEFNKEFAQLFSAVLIGPLT